jgi:hypothetical protein
MALTGDLKEFQLQEVLQILALGRKTGILALSGDRVHGTIVLSTGQLLDARAGQLSGESAFLALADNRGGTFTFTSLPVDELPAPERPFVRSLEALLIELSAGVETDPDTP